MSLKGYKLIESSKNIHSQLLKESPYLLNVLLWVITKVPAIIKVGHVLADVSSHCEGSGKNAHYSSLKLASYVEPGFQA